MKTYKQLREKYHSRVKSTPLNKTATVFTNPSRKEFFELLKNVNEEGVSGFVIPDDKLYLWDTALHEDVRPKILKGNEKINHIPIRVIPKSRTSVKILLSNDMRWSSSKYQDLDAEDVADIVDKNKPLNRLFSNLDIDRWIFWS